MSIGIKVYTSLTKNPRRPKGKISYELAVNRHEYEVLAEEESKQTIALKKQERKEFFIEGRWLNKKFERTFGFRRHYTVDCNGLFFAVHGTTAKEYYFKGLAPLLEQLLREQLKDRMLAGLLGFL